MQKHPTHKSAKGFTLIELVIAVAIIGILTSVAVLGYNQYKVRAYDAHSKQALRDILLQCNAFWLDQDASKVCNHATVAEVYVASDEIVLKFPSKDLPDLPAGSQGNFCASAQHE
ncbi:MAG: prepilin-type N-terminal cleavage/methylation domain-containing protein, partial [Desulfatiglandales bacterium]|nr:prepilin-type N-terminal cleavage/methylation domain-containing protein [Desulfatiglandales bacterium]